MLGENIRRIRTERDMSQQELAEKVGVIQAAISRIESGAVNPRYTTLLALAAALGVGLDELTKVNMSVSTQVQ